MSTIATLQHHDLSLEVTWADGVVTHYPWLWLRDHAHDADTLHPLTQRRELFTACVCGLRGLSTEVVAEALHVTWDVLEPVSVLPIAFLAAHRYPRVARTALDVPVSLWNASSVHTPKVAHDLVMNTDAGLVQWLTNTLQYGFCIATDTPPTAEATEALMRRVADIRVTGYGALWPGTPQPASTAPEQRAHTDGSFANDGPGFQMLHYLQADGEGGESTFVDAFAIARRMEAEHPDEFEILSAVAVPGQQILGNTQVMAVRPVFRHDHTGRLAQVTFNNYERAPFLLAESDMLAFYDALRVFDELANDAAMQWRQVLQPGEAVLFDNWRLVHGSASFTGVRRMCGGYLNREDVEGRLRMLRR